MSGAWTLCRMCRPSTRTSSRSTRRPRPCCARSTWPSSPASSCSSSPRAAGRSRARAAAGAKLLGEGCCSRAAAARAALSLLPGAGRAEAPRRRPPRALGRHFYSTPRQRGDLERSCGPATTRRLCERRVVRGALCRIFAVVCDENCHSKRSPCLRLCACASEKILTASAWRTVCATGRDFRSFGPRRNRKRQSAEMSTLNSSSSHERLQSCRGACSVGAPRAGARPNPGAGRGHEWGLTPREEYPCDKWTFWPRARVGRSGCPREDLRYGASGGAARSQNGEATPPGAREDRADALRLAPNAPDDGGSRPPPPLLPKGRSESAVPEPSWAGLPSTSSSAGGGARAQPGGVAGPGAHPVRPALPLAQRPRRHRLHHQEARRCSERDLGPPGDPRSGVRSGACSGAPDRARRPPRPHRPLTPSSPAPPAHR